MLNKFQLQLYNFVIRKLPLHKICNAFYYIFLLYFFTYNNYINLSFIILINYVIYNINNLHNL